MRQSGARWRAAIVVCAVVVLGTCGKRGDPLPPLRPIPARITDLAARRTADRVDLSFTVPAANEDGTTPPAADRVDLYALTLPADAPPPTTAVLMAGEANVIGRLTIRETEESDAAAAPPSSPASQPTASSPGRFIEPGAVARFTDTIPTTEPPPALAAPEATGRSTDAPAPGSPVRYYMAVAIAGTGAGRPGQPSDVLRVSTGPLPAAPANVVVTHDAAETIVSWQGEAADRRFRVWRVTGGETPDELLTAEPIAETSYKVPVAFGREVCFSIRAVEGTTPVTAEGPASEPRCLTPVDTFPPPAPTGLEAVAGADAVTLVWSAVDASDLAGYVVLRGEGTADALQPLFRDPIAATTYRDATAQPGVTYTYAVYAVDRAPAANVSQLSSRQSATVR